MFSRSRVLAVAFTGLGAILGYAAASGKINLFERAAASSSIAPHPTTTTLAPTLTCCAETDIKAELHSQVTAHNTRVTATMAQAGKKPNILVIFGDDIGQTNVSAYSMGVMGYRTPNIDRIAKEGMIFTDYYAEQSCTAGRSSFITGQCTLRTGLSKVGIPGATAGLQKEDPTIPSYSRITATRPGNSARTTSAT
jgi:hypothetical protein